jgi:DNA-binding CsgD family transcriptional regulator
VQKKVMTETYRTSKIFKRVVSRERDFPCVNFQDSESTKIFTGAAFLENCFPHSVLILCKINHPTIAYVSNNAKTILGYTASYLKSLNPEEYFSLVHPDDAKLVRMCYERMSQEMELKSYCPENWKFSMNYRLRSSNGKYLFVVDEKNAFQYEPGRYIHYSIVQNIENPKFYGHPFLGIYKKTALRFRKIQEYIPKVPNEQITVREKQILKYIESGMGTREIAESLHISKYTVRNHRSNLLKKTSTKTSIQALHYAKSIGWI